MIEGSVSLTDESISEIIAEATLDRFRIKHPALLKKLGAKIRDLGGKPVEIKIFWDSSKQDIDFEVIP